MSDDVKRAKGNISARISLIRKGLHTPHMAYMLERQPSPPGTSMKKYLRFLGHILVSAIFILAVYLLYHKLKAYSIAQIRQSLQQISYIRIAFSILLMIVNYMILVGYDWLALKAIHKKLPLSKISLVSFVGQAVSYNFGALLGGTSVRYRFYSAWGFSISDIVRLVLMLAVTFWVGALGLCGIIFLVAPPVIPEDLLIKMPIADIRILGGILAAIASSWLVFCFTLRKPIHIFGRELVFPAPHIAVAQAVVASIDLIAAAACMYVLLPSSLNISFMDFLPGYLLAQVAVVLTHIPGGVGVFELVILEMTHTPEAQTVFAAVLLFRLIYYILPLLAAAVVLAAYEAVQRREMMREAGRWLSVLSHSIASYLAFCAGIILLVSATLPTAFKSLPHFFLMIPKPLMAAGHFVCALGGAALLFLAYGLEKRQRRAYRLTVIMLCAGICGALLKGFSWETALMTSMVLLAVCLAKKRFYRTSFFFEQRIPLQWCASALGALAFVFLLGWFLYNPAWNRAELWGFDRAFNASRTLLAYAAILAMIFLGWLWRFWLRKRSAQS